MRKIKLNKDKINMVPNNTLKSYKLKDGRRVFTTHNNFKYWLEDKKGVVIPVTEKYYKNSLKNKIDEN